ncbi:MAG TPA: phosphoribosylaminoimidazolesuccinocarboxamide synthase, partial [Pirellulales bacterium]
MGYDLLARPTGRSPRGAVRPASGERGPEKVVVETGKLGKFVNQNSTHPVLLESDVPGWPVRRGKVRDVYDLGDKLLIVASDRISAFDWILPTGVPDKGRVLTQLSAFWFERIGTPH